jgi:NhaA family Na+:H+ antiporter
MHDEPSASDVTELPPGASARAHRFSRAVRRPIERFIHVQAASGILLLFALMAGVGELSVRMTLHAFVNDILMAIFFFVIGLEVREIFSGELSSLRRASLPVLAALGGMVVPAVIFLVVGPADARTGWSVPVSTDTAFALGVLALLGRRIAPSLRVMLLAIAIIDDILAIAIIALFYSSTLELRGVVLMTVGVAMILCLQRFGVRHVAAYLAPALVVWAGCTWAGIHPTLAGIVVGLLTPVKTWYGQQGFVDAAHRHLGTIARRLNPVDDQRHDIDQPMMELRRAQREVVSPVVRIEAALHPWAAFVIMPVFALANAGLDFGRVDISAAPRLLERCDALAPRLLSVQQALVPPPAASGLDDAVDRCVESEFRQLVFPKTGNGKDLTVDAYPLTFHR